MSHATLHTLARCARIAEHTLAVVVFPLAILGMFAIVAGCTL